MLSILLCMYESGCANLASGGVENMTLEFIIPSDNPAYGFISINRKAFIYQVIRLGVQLRALHAPIRIDEQSVALAVSHVQLQVVCAPGQRMSISIRIRGVSENFLSHIVRTEHSLCICGSGRINIRRCVISKRTLHKERPYQNHQNAHRGYYLCHIVFLFHRLIGWIFRRIV